MRVVLEQNTPFHVTPSTQLVETSIPVTDLLPAPVENLNAMETGKPTLVSQTILRRQLLLDLQRVVLNNLT